MGRREIIVDNEIIDKRNVIDVLQKAFQVHTLNRAEIIYLTNYEKGNQPILNRVKEIRPEINNKVVENHAAEIVDFYKGYIFGNPVAYTQRTVKDNPNTVEIENAAGMAKLNEIFLEVSKSAKDQKLVKDILTCGVGYRMLLPKEKMGKRETSPFRLIQLPPENTFVIRNCGVEKRIIAGVTYYTDTNNIPHFSIYTDNSVFFIDGGVEYSFLREEKNGIGLQPIIEYRLNDDRMGIFERVLPLLDAINLCTSDRMNGLAQYIQSFVWMNNVDMSDSDLERLKAGLFLLTKSADGNSAAHVEYLATPLNQQSEQVLKDDLYENVLKISGVPNREGNTGGDTGQAVILRNGFAEAESKAKSMEPIFEACEREMLLIALNIIDRANKQEYSDISALRLSDIEIKISRNRTDEMLTKLQALQIGLNAGVAPYDMFVTVGLFDDPDQVYKNSLPYLAKYLYDEDAMIADSNNENDTENPV